LGVIHSSKLESNYSLPPSWFLSFHINIYNFSIHLEFWSSRGADVPPSSSCETFPSPLRDTNRKHLSWIYTEVFLEDLHLSVA
ncbi:uncharacterized, partial [Tachysurus ichikawai]